MRSFAVDRRFGWSASRRFFAIGGSGRLFDNEGSPVRRHEYPLSIGRGWRWSPVADCAVRLAKDGALLAEVVNPSKIPPVWGTTLMNDGVESVRFSPDGKWLSLLLRNAGRQRVLAVADLRSGTVRVLETRPGCCYLLGWSPDGGTILYGRSHSASIAMDGVKLLGVTPSGDTFDYGISVLWWRRSTLSCGDRFLALTSRWRDATDQGRILELSSDRDPKVIAGPTPSYIAAACPPSGSFLAAVRSPELYDGRYRARQLTARRVELLGPDGSPLRLLANETGFGDDAPEWGPSGTGLMFVRFAQRGPGAVWFAREGEAARSLGMNVARPGLVYGIYRWSWALDWSATPPPG